MVLYLRSWNCLNYIDFIILNKSQQMDQNFDNMATILRMFKVHNCHEETLLTKEQLTKILNKQANYKIGKEFNSQIVRQVWGQAETNSRGQSTMRTFAKIINNAINILESRLYRIQSDDVGIPHYQTQLKQTNSKLLHLEAEYQAGFLEYYEKINIQRKNKVIIENKVKELQEQELEFRKDLEEIKTCIQPMPLQPVKPVASPPAQPVQNQNGPLYSYLPSGPSRSAPMDRSQIIQVPDNQGSFSYEKRPNPDLLLLFQLAIIGILVQFLVLTMKVNFLPLLCYFLVVFWLFLGYYDKMFVLYIMIGLGMSILFDLIYILLQLTGHVNTVNPTGSGFIVLLIILLVLQLVVRVIMIIKLMPFKTPSKKEQYFQLLGRQVELRLRAGKRDSLR